MCVGGGIWMFVFWFLHTFFLHGGFCVFRVKKIENSMNFSLLYNCVHYDGQ